MAMPELKLQWLLDAFEKRFIDRGIEYARQGKVIFCDWDEDRRILWGDVHGSGGELYETALYLDDVEKGLPLEARCTCPVGYNCKHAVALFFTAMAQRNTLRSAAGARDMQADDLQKWLAAAKTGKTDFDSTPRARSTSKQKLIYSVGIISDLYEGRPEVIVTPLVAYVRKDDSLGNTQSFNLDRIGPNFHPPGYMMPEDLDLLAQLMLRIKWHGNERCPILKPHDQVLFKSLLATGRCFWQEVVPLREGSARSVTPAWVVDDSGMQLPRWESDPPFEWLLPLDPPWYVDTDHGEAGPADSKQPIDWVWWLSAPPVEPKDVKQVRKALEGMGLPQPKSIRRKQTGVKNIQPVARFGVFKRYDDMHEELAVWLSFDYDGARACPFEKAPISRLEGDTLITMQRNPQLEMDAVMLLESFELTCPEPEICQQEQAAPFTQVVGYEESWRTLAAELVPTLMEAGWRVEFDEHFPFPLKTLENIEISLTEDDHGWFDTALKAEIDGKPVDLVPLLAQAVRVHEKTLRHWRELPETHRLPVWLNGRQQVLLPTHQLGPVFDVLLELYEGDPAQGVRLPPLRAAELVDSAQETLPVQGEAVAQLQQLVQKLKNARAPTPLDAPEGFKASLRPYQREGLGWLQFLRAYQLNGILADDMGLGKTVQTLAHILTEKRAGRLDRPALVIAPTSLMFNWRHEAEQFAPELSVLTLHGPQRKQLFDRIPEHDVVLTTYPLLHRDEAALSDHDYHLLILDEAQHIKNPRAKASQVVRSLKAHYKLCLSGTPLENHLGELWALFDFLMPGLLGDEKQFRRAFRNPIEKEQDQHRAQLLAHRIAPFVLRRTKEEVVKELPPKTEIVRSIALEGAQRTLYESVRASMHEKVRKAVEKKGFKRSQIEILDALLKLRQICCDPRLLKLSAAKKVKRSAKLDLLMDMLPEMIAEGRRILLFSQFTSMLKLIEEALDKANIDYVKLTGQTRNRQTPVARFQAGEVPVFLISLKAGGVGLNLTAADTVIHYDPWWNPAVEDQATDRAYRIGQDKPVFVYKLITENTVEAKIQEMQQQKRALAEALLDENSNNLGALSPDVLDALFAPLE